MAVGHLLSQQTRVKATRNACPRTVGSQNTCTPSEQGTTSPISASSGFDKTPPGRGKTERAQNETWRRLAQAAVHRLHR